MENTDTILITTLSQNKELNLTSGNTGWWVSSVVASPILGPGLTPLNSPGNAAGLLGQNAASFSAASKQLLYDASLNSTKFSPRSSSFTVFASVYVTSLDALKSQVIIGKDDDIADVNCEYLLNLYVPGGGISMMVESNGGTPVLTAAFAITAADLNKWFTVIAWYDSGTGKVNLSINNRPALQSVGTVTGPVNYAPNTPFSIGCDYNTSNPNNSNSFISARIQFAGLIKRVLTQSERYSLYRGLDNWTMGNANVNPTFNPTLSADVPAVLSSNVNSTKFDGSDDYVGAVNSFAFTSEGGVSIFFQPSATTLSSGQVLVGNSGNSNAYIKIHSSTVIRVQTDTAGTFKDYTVPLMTAGTWYHVFVNRTSGTTTVYLNATQSVTGGQAQAPDMTIDQLGKYWNGGSGLMFDGKLSEVKMYNTHLSSADITLLAAGGAASVTPAVFLKLNSGPNASLFQFYYKNYNSDPGFDASNYAALPTSMTSETTTVFPAWYELTEGTGTRVNSRLN